jgi:hypothetical protein
VSAPTKRTNKRATAPRKVTVVPPEERAKRRAARAESAPVVPAAVPESAVPATSNGIDPQQRLQQQMAALTGVDEAEVIQVLTQRLGEAERQRIMDGIVITRLVRRVLELSPQDPVATEVAEQQKEATP